jgi:hypothetical protein
VANRAEKTDFITANFSCPSLVRGEMERRMLVHHGKAIHAIALLLMDYCLSIIYAAVYSACVF